MGDVPLQCLIQKGTSLQSTCVPVSCPHMARFKRGWIFSEIAELPKIQYLMWVHHRKVVQLPALGEDLFDLALTSSLWPGEKHLTSISLLQFIQISHYLVLVKGWKFSGGGKRQSGRTGEHRAVDVLLMKKSSRQHIWSKRFTTFLLTFHKSIFCSFQWDNTESTVSVTRHQLRDCKLLRQNPRGWAWLSTQSHMWKQ